MRIRQTAISTLLLALAIPSIGAAQIVIPYTRVDIEHVDRLDHAVPVATVTLPGDAIALSRPEQGEGFVLGDAQLNLKNPERPTVVFTIANGSDTPLPLSGIAVHEARVNARAQDGALNVPCSFGKWLGMPGQAEGALQPGAIVTVEMPVAPRCGPTMGDTVGFLVFLEGKGRPLPSFTTHFYQTDDLLRSAFVMLRTQAQQ